MKSFNPLVSIIIPVYNGSNYVRQAINSALAQTYKNIEIIVINDGSKDNTEKIVKSYGGKIRYFKKKNGGVATALNLGIKKMRGEYFSWLSHDDLYYSDKVEKQVKVLSKESENDRKNIILMSNYALIDEKSRIITKTCFERSHLMNNLQYPLYGLLHGIVNGLTLLIPKSCFEDFGYFDPALRATQDYALWFKFFPKCRIIFMTDLLAKTRIHLGQVTNKPATFLENDTLWINMVKKMNVEQKINVGGSVIGFYQKVYEIVKSAKFVGAEKFLSEKIEKYKNRNISLIKVSVIIPFCNNTSWILKAIKSVIKQTHQNLEILVIDYGSTENIQKILKLCRSDERIKYFRSENICELSEIRTLGIKKSTGEFIAFLDSNSLFLPNKIENQLIFMVSNGYTFSHTSYEMFESAKERYNKKTLGKINYFYPSIISNCLIETSTVMMHKDLFKIKNNIFLNKNIKEDVCWWIECSKKCNLYGLDMVLTRIEKNIDVDPNNNFKKIAVLKSVFDYVFENSLDRVSVSDFGKLNNLLLRDISVAYPPFFMSFNQKEKMVLDKIYSYSLVGHMVVRIYLRAKKILGIYET